MSVTIESHPMCGRVSILVPLVEAVVHPVVVYEPFHLRESAVAHDLEDVFRDVFYCELLGPGFLPALPASGIRKRK